jgi:hypothetical protein
MRVILLLLLCAPLDAREVRINKKTNIERLEADLRAAGFQIEYSACAEASCTMVLPDSEKKDPSAIIAAHTYIDPAIEKDRMRLLAKKWKDGAITDAEKDELLKFLVWMMLGG